MKLKIMPLVSLTTVVSLLAASLLANGPGEVSSEGKQLQGTWIVQNAERNGNKDEVLLGVSYRFEDGKLTVLAKDVKLAARTFTYEIAGKGDPEKSSRIIFRRVKDSGTPDENGGMVGIFRLTDGSLELCHCSVPENVKGLQGGPKEFRTKPGSGEVYVVLKKK